MAKLLSRIKNRLQSNSQNQEFINIMLESYEMIKDLRRKLQDNETLRKIDPELDLLYVHKIPKHIQDSVRQNCIKLDHSYSKICKFLNLKNKEGFTKNYLLMREIFQMFILVSERNYLEKNSLISTNRVLSDEIKNFELIFKEMKVNYKNKPIQNEEAQENNLQEETINTNVDFDMHWKN